MDPSRGDSRYNLNYSMSSIGLSLADQADLYGNPAAAAALGGRPPSGGLIQSMGGGGNGGMQGGRSSGGLMSNANQCQSLSGSGTGGVGGNNSVQSRGIKRTNSDCYDDHHRIGGGGGGSGGMTSQSLQGLESCAGVGGGGSGGGGGGGVNVSNPGQQQQQQGNVPDVVDDSYTSLQNKKSPPANGKKTKGRVKIKMEYIDNKLRRYTTFSKRKTGIMKKAYELSTLTGTQVMLLVASETGHVYTFATRKLQPMITSEAGKQLIQTCLNSPDPPSVGGGDQRMSATGFEETELSYNIADEDSKDDRSPMTSGNESDDSSDVESPGPPSLKSSQTMVGLTDGNFDLKHHDADAGATTITTTTLATATATATTTPTTINNVSDVERQNMNALDADFYPNEASTSDNRRNTAANIVYPTSALSSLPQEVLLGLIQSGHLQLHTEEDGSGHQYITIPLSMATVADGATEHAAKGNGASQATTAPAATTGPTSTSSASPLRHRFQHQQHRRQLEQAAAAAADSSEYSAIGNDKEFIQIKQEILD